MTTTFIIDRLLQPDISLQPSGRLSRAPEKNRHLRHDLLAMLAR
jgi:hypothetical protein